MNDPSFETLRAGQFGIQFSKLSKIDLNLSTSKRLYEIYEGNSLKAFNDLSSLRKTNRNNTDHDLINQLIERHKYTS
jgi:hypothetical protein